MELIQFIRDYDYSHDVKIRIGETFKLDWNGEWYISEILRDGARIWFQYKTVHQWFLTQGIAKIIDE